MEFWEGAILVVGGLWLVGRMTKGSVKNLAKAPSKSSAGTTTAAGNTTATNMSGSSSLIAGEPLTPMGPLLSVPTTIQTSPVSVPPKQSPVTVSRFTKMAPVGHPIPAVHLL